MTRKLTPDQLDEIEAVAREARLSQWRWPKFDDLEQVNGHIGAHSRHIAMMDPATTLALVAEVRELRAKVERVREVHEPSDAMMNPGRYERVVKVCIGCGTDDGNWQRYPCPTTRALGEGA